MRVTNVTTNERRVKCATCARAGKKSVVYPQYEKMAGGVLFYDEDGRLHSHIASAGQVRYRCEHGHEWEDQENVACWCGWVPNKKEEKKK